MPLLPQSTLSHRRVLPLCLLVIITLCASISTLRAAPNLTIVGQDWRNISTSILHDLDDGAHDLQSINNSLNQASTNPDNTTLDALIHQAQTTQQTMRGTIDQLQSFDDITQSYLKILGPKAADHEDSAITTQRAALLSNAQAVQTSLMRAKLYALQAQQLIATLNARRMRLHHATLWEPVPSPLNPHFWASLASENAENHGSFHKGGTLKYWGTLLGSLLATFLITPLIIPAILRIALRKPAISEDEETPTIGTSLRGGIFVTFLGGLVGAIVAGLLWAILIALLPGGAALDGNIFALTLAQTLPFCGFIIGTGHALTGRHSPLAQHHPDLAALLRKVDGALAIAIVTLNILRTALEQDVFGPTLLIVLEILFVLSVNITAILIFRKLRAIEGTNSFAPSLLGLMVLTFILSSAAILLRHTPTAFFLIGWLLTLGTALLTTGLLALFWRHALEQLLNPEGRIGRHLSGLGLPERRLQQLTVLLSGLGNLFLFFLLVSTAQTSGSANPGDVGERLRLLFVGNTIGGVHVSLGTILTIILIFFAASYLIQQVRQWIRDRFLPTTRLDIGARNSITSIFTYCSWILVGLFELSLAGLSVQNLTWVVSALSVGIGFGLQSIVQNFVSGIILLAERPVRIGDVVEISGNRGDVKRISIRATELNLSDGSTVIVPNSQFITSSVKNATFSGATSALSMTFNVPTSCDLDAVRMKLIEIAAERDEVLADPAPTVRINALGDATVTMVMTVRLSTPKDASKVQDAVLFGIFRRFREEYVKLTTV
ncbi:DUF3772 domain-containing protein [Neokomagataea anthophila]|uniref:DUF3772 domain-containing protein n=1 Tax=Neokomagataea anthophila TaxID=2826925 RepID=A0ABS5E409_9PROT|nr:DUF3772 domain-containing protein [Neokomagataea anthophila]MBR0558642.1 DUF3772 domain-containing protein [Neokomagataea anthophila]